MYNKKQPDNFIYYDTSKVYLCPMIRKDSEYPNEIEDTIEVKLEEARYGYDVIPLVDGYHKKYFYDLFLRWLFHTKYIVEKPVKND